MSEYTFKTVGELSYLPDDERRIVHESWPEFMLNDPVANVYFGRLYEDFTDFQFALYNGDEVIGIGNSIPVIWNLDAGSLPDDGWDWALTHGFELLENGTAPTTLCAISMVLARSHQGRGASRHGLLAMKSIAARHGLNALIAPVRPSLKHRYPLIPMERYVTWTDADSAPFDPWLRTHWRMGAIIAKVAPRAMRIPGTVADWESWTNMKFPESGEYVVPFALNPVTADVERDLITYVEPNVWMHHPIP